MCASYSSCLVRRELCLREVPNVILTYEHQTTAVSAAKKVSYVSIASLYDMVLRRAPCCQVEAARKAACTAAPIISQTSAREGRCGAAAAASRERELGNSNILVNSLQRTRRYKGCMWSWNRWIASCTARRRSANSCLQMQTTLQENIAATQLQFDSLQAFKSREQGVLEEIDS